MALKILPDAFASDPDRLARFTRAHTLAALNHPNNAHIHGLEESAGVRAGVFVRSFDLHPDGERFALAPVTETQPAAKQDTLVFSFNLFDELRRIAPVPKR